MSSDCVFTVKFLQKQHSSFAIQTGVTSVGYSVFFLEWVIVFPHFFLVQSKITEIQLLTVVLVSI